MTALRTRPIYFDNASTSFPKPDLLWETTRQYLNEVGASPGRGSHSQARQAKRIVDEARAALAQVVGVTDPSRIAFTLNATHALNIAIRGSLAPGDHVITTDIEHNSVLRPLEELRLAGKCTYTVVRTAPDGTFDLAAFRAALRPETKLMVVNHASNVTGVVAPVAELAAIARAHGALFLLDASQTAGFLDIEVDELGVDMLALTGHKSLKGPPGTGALFVRHPLDIRPLEVGGSGVNSQSLRHPATMPDKLEAGTANYLGIAGLGAVVATLTPAGIAADRAAALTLMQACLASLRTMSGITVYEVRPDLPRVPVISLNIEGLYASEVSALLDERFQIMTRAGLHCAPLIHQTLGTTPHGTLRISVGSGSTADDIDRLIEALDSIREQAVPMGVR
ncbi:aminotransferase class V-fold PLP-dependent enzyme [Micromonospora sp. LOL_021]|uniref:aminotransferase class V-fold PLP-dependent enzyme n=1 Tax=Micromonospora sp. LOL_021 TaxID=3345417 RepID=UPI003A88B98F